MAETFAEFEATIAAHGRSYASRVCGRQRDDGIWEGWIEFEDTATGESLRSERETTQPDASDLRYWATGLTPVYLEGALNRALKTAAAETPVETFEPPAFEAPAERPDVRRQRGGHAVLDPFSVYEKSADLLAQELTALRGWHLRQIIDEYGLAKHSDEPLDSLTERELGSLILRRVRDLHT